MIMDVYDLTKKQDHYLNVILYNFNLDSDNDKIVRNIVKYGFYTDEQRDYLNGMKITFGITDAYFRELEHNYIQKINLQILKIRYGK